VVAGGMKINLTSGAFKAGNRLGKIEIDQTGKADISSDTTKLSIAKSGVDVT